ncbi:MAG: PAS domain S-box protein [Bacteroidales bacterium]|jgi:PAS domain S-box-containing protein|nr:PAS domain S-box protein [Bacteroidales bacterium]HOI32479.1 PAS domain S-box protein [Bacteroidales bacterium]
MTKKNKNISTESLQLKKDASLLHALFDNHPNAMVFVDDNFNIQFFNKKAVDSALFFEKKQMKLGDDIHDFVTGEDPEAFNGLFNKALHGIPQSFIKTYTVEDKEYYLQFDFQPVNDLEAFKGVFLQVTNVTSNLQDLRNVSLTQAALYESEQRYKSLVESAFDAIYVIRDHKFEYVNKRYEQLTGFSFKDVTHPDFKIEQTLTEKSKKIMEERFEARRKGEPVPSNYEFQVKRKDGKVVEVEISTALLQSDDDMVVLGIMRDISDRIETQKALQRERAYFKHLFESIPFGVVILSNQDVVLECNQTFLKMFVYKKAQVIGQPINELIVPDFLKNEGNDLTTDVASGNIIFSETTRRTSDGKLLQVSIHGHPVVLPDGNKIIFGAYQDISGRKKMEQALDQERELMNALMDTIPDTIYFKDTGSNFLRVNKAQLKVLGVEKQKEAIGKSDFDFFDQEHAQRAYEEERKVMALDKPLINRIEKVETAVGTKWFSATKVPLKNGNNEIIGLAGISRDITEIKSLEESLRKNEAYLSELNAEKDKLFSILAHDLRAPFNSFIMLSELFVDEQYNLSLDEMRRMAASMHKAASNLTDLLDNLLDWSKLQRNLFQIEKSRIKLELLVEETLDMLNDSIKRKKLNLKVKIPDNFKIIADKRMLSGILRNLLSNAVKFTPDGGNILISAGVTESESFITVKDSGIGIPERLMPILFRIDGNTGRKGTAGEPSSGLGLILVKEFIEKHNGRIEIDSVENVGSTFNVFFPLKDLV